MSSILFILLSASSLGKEGVLIREGGEVVGSDQVGVEQDSTASLISIDVVRADIHNVIRLFATHTGHNFVIADGVEGKVTVKVEKVPWDQALQAILWSKGLVASNLGSVTIISH
jgi:type II secretory pathway component HofQ